MAYFLCNVQGFPLLGAASAKLLKKLQFPCFSHCRKALFLWFHCAKGTKPSFIRPLPRFHAEFEHVTAYEQMAHGLFSLQFSKFSFALGGFCQTAEKVAVSIVSMGSLPISSFSFALGRSIRENCWTSCHFRTAGKSHFYDFIVLRGPSPVSFVHCPKFPAEFEHVTT